MKNKGFTLVELISTIVILGIVLLIAVPTASNVIKDRKNNAFLAKVKAILRKVEYDDVDNELEGTVYLSELNLSDLKSDEYDLENSYVYKCDDKIYISIIGKGKYENIILCNVTSSTKDIEIVEDSCVKKDCNQA